MEYITTKEAAAMIGVTAQTVRNLIAANDFAPGYAVTAKKFIYRRDDVVGWLQGRKINIAKMTAL